MRLRRQLCPRRLCFDNSFRQKRNTEASPYPIVKGKASVFKRRCLNVLCGRITALLTPRLFVKLRIVRVKVLAVQVVLYYPQPFTETLEVNYLTLAQKLDRVAHIGVVRVAQNVVVCLSRFLLCCNGKSATFANKINPHGFILYYIPLKTEYITIFARKLYHILPLAKYITKNSSEFQWVHRWFL